MKLLMLELRDNVIRYVNADEIIFVDKEDRYFTITLSDGLEIGVPADSNGGRAIQRLITNAQVV